MSQGLQNSTGPAMEPQATHGSENHYTTNKGANGLRAGSTGDGVKGYSLVLPQLKDKFYSVSANPDRAKKAGNFVPKSWLGLQTAFQPQTSMRSPDSMPRSAGSSLPESFVPSKKKESLSPESPMASS